MAPKRLRNPHLQGVLVVAKPAGKTSHDVVSVVRSAMRLDKVGHAGTLDPFATGVLPLMINSATRIAPMLTGDDKVYQGVGRLGITTDTLDPTGQVTEEKPTDDVTRADLEAVLEGFVGEIEQLPPMFSAAKVNGERLYKLARKNVEVERKPKQVTIHSLELLEVELPRFTFRVHCSSGTYVRAVVDDAGRELGCGGHLEQLVRLRSGRFSAEHAITLDDLGAAADRFHDLERDHDPLETGKRWHWPHPEASAFWTEQLGAALRPIPDALDLPTLPVNDDVLRRLRNGEPVRAGDLPAAAGFDAGDELLVQAPDGRIAALVRAQCRAELVSRMAERTPVLQVARGFKL